MSSRSTSRHGLACAVAATLLAFVAGAAWADAPADTKPIRELIVPFSELNVLLESRPRRVMLPREQYDDLLKRAEKTKVDEPPQAATLLSAAYVAELDRRQATINAVLRIEVLKDGLHAVPLAVHGAWLQEALLDGQPAPLGPAEGGGLTLFVTGQGRHELAMTLLLPLTVSSAMQELKLRLPHPAATTMRLSAPGDVELKSGAELLSRTIEQQPTRTRFELLLPGEQIHLVLSLNSHLQQSEKAVVARSVLVDEVTQAYERLHATVSLDVLHQPIDHFELALPADFEVGEVSSTHLARWTVSKTARKGENVVSIRFRQATSESIVLNLTAIRTVRPNQWEFPRLVPLGASGEAAVIGLLVEDRLTATNIKAEDVIPIDTDVIRQALPASVLRAEPGAPRVVPVVAYYAPTARYALSATLTAPPDEVDRRTASVLSIKREGLALDTRVTFVSRSERLFSFDVSVPAGWDVRHILGADGQPLVFERHAAPDGIRLRVLAPRAVAPGAPLVANIAAVRTPDGWLAEWKSQAVEFPQLKFSLGVSSAAVVAVQAEDDYELRPTKTEQLTALDEAAKAPNGLPATAESLAYRVEGADWQGAFEVRRATARITARTFSFLRVESDAVDAHYEIAYTVENARVRRLAFSLPGDTPAGAEVRGLRGVEVKESSTELAGARRRWTVLLDDARNKDIRIAVAFKQPLPAEAQKTLRLPLVAAENVVYQSGLVSVEGSAELDTRLTAEGARPVDIGELADADYMPGRRLLGAFGYVTDQADAKVAVSAVVTRNPSYPLYAAIAQQAELRSIVSAAGQCVTVARFRLRTKATLLEVGMPAHAELWSALVDDTPVTPQRRAATVLIPLAAKTNTLERRLELTYASSVGVARLTGRQRLPAPSLAVRMNASAPPQTVPLADVVWKVELPTGYELIASGGSLTPTVHQVTPVAALALADGLWQLNSTLCPAVNCARDSARRGSSFKGAEQPMSELVLSAEQAADRPAAADEKEALRADGVDRRMQPGAAPAKPAESKPSSTEVRPQEPARRLNELGDFDSDSFRERKREEGFAGRGAAGRGEVFAFDGAAVSHRSKRKSTDKLLGVRSLKIELQEARDDQHVVEFRGLGLDPQLELTLVNRARFNALGLALALAVLLAGATLVGRSYRCKARLVLWVLIFSTIVPLAFDSPWLTQQANLVFGAGCLLPVIYLAAGFARWLVGAGRWAVARIAGFRRPALAALVLSTVLAACSSLLAGEPNVVVHIEPTTPVNVPDDVVIRPYEGLPNQVDGKEPVLVPYDRYVELWNLAYPDKRLSPTKLPADHALSGAVYTATLVDEEYLALSGAIDLEIYADGQVAIPFALRGAVLTSARLDDQPARFGAGSAPMPKTTQAKAPAAESTMLLLHAQGKGRHRLVLEVRVKLDRRGGWRQTDAALPAAPATRLTVIVPQRETELRLGEAAERLTQTTTADGEKVATAFGPGGRLSLQWRRIVAESQVDQALTVRSQATLDVQEEGSRLVWQADLSFPRSQRDSFRVEVPGDYLVVKVEGPNVRGWETRRNADHQRVEITLLKAARDRESFTVTLAQAARRGPGVRTEFAAPYIRIEESSLHTGRMVIRRSPLVDLRVTADQGVGRDDMPHELPADKAGATVSPLGLQPYRAYAFTSVPFRLLVACEPVAAQVTADVQTLLRISQYERGLESRIVMTSRHRPLYEIQIEVPKGLELKLVSVPGEFQWTITPADRFQLLTIQMAAGRRGDTPVVLRGILERGKLQGDIALPRLALRNVERQQGQIAVQADPAYRVEPVGWQQCEPILLEQVRRWVATEQFANTRLALAYRTADYAGGVRLSTRQPQVSCFTVTNVRVTSRAIQETNLLDFTIRNAGIREIRFSLPAAAEQPRIQARLIRQKTIERQGAGPDARWNVRLELQDEIMGQYRVLVESDRAATSDSGQAPIPRVEAARVDRQFVTLETAGGAEVVAGKTEGLEPLGRQQREWQTLTTLLGNGIGQAYLSWNSEVAPSLAYRSLRRDAVATVGARIGLAETDLVLDTHGAYRAQAVFLVSNSTEQFLVVKLPTDAVLWTVRVADEPVKPARDASGNDRLVRIPLVKTARGDVPYNVVLKYGGAMSVPRIVGKFQFPLIQTENVTVERSLVYLFLPETYQWFQFGGTMRQAASDAEIEAGWAEFRNKQRSEFDDAKRDPSDPYARARANSNYKAIDKLGSNTYSGQTTINSNANIEVLNDAQKDVVAFEDRAALAEQNDNRNSLYNAYQQQSNDRALNRTSDLGLNWSLAKESESQRGTAQGSFNTDWLATNGLVAPTQIQSKSDVSRFGTLNVNVAQSAGDLVEKAKDVSGQKGQSQLGQQVAPTTASGGNVMGNSSNVMLNGGFATTNNANTRQEEAQTLQRYQQRLAIQNSAQGPQGAVNLPAAQAPSSGAMLGGGIISTTPATPPAGAPAAQPAAPVQTPAPNSGLASLDVDIPLRGTVYRFTTPMGATQITAWATSNRLLLGMKRVAIGLIVAIALLAVAKLLPWLVRLTDRRPYAAAFMVLGMLMLCAGFLPLIGAFLTLLGMVQLVRHTLPVAASA